MRVRPQQPQGYGLPVMVYVLFLLSPKNVNDLRHEIGIEGDHKTARL
jgi:hypothetical protein